MITYPSKVRLAFVGDICLGLELEKSIPATEAERVFAQVKDQLSAADVRIGNLECCLVDGAFDRTVRENPMAAPVALAESLNEARFGVLSLANNHILDCGDKSLSLAIEFCRRKGIQTVGAGSNRDEALRPAIVEVNGHRLAFLAFGDTERYYAKKTRPGIAPIEPDIILNAVDVAKRMADALIVILHADLEFGFHPATWRVRLARKIAEGGADIVVQHHPHVLQGIERHQGSIIAYSIGNFVFPWYESEYLGHRFGVNESVILNVTLDYSDGPPSLSYETIPVIIGQDGLPQVASGEVAGKIVRHIDMTSGALGDPRSVQVYWYARCCEELRYQTGGLYWTLRDHGPVAFLKRLVRTIRRKDHRRWIKGLMSFGRF